MMVTQTPPPVKTIAAEHRLQTQTPSTVIAGIGNAPPSPKLKASLWAD
jgi:hypothetical protein